MSNNFKKILISAHYYTQDTVLTGKILRNLAKCMLDILKITAIYVVPSYFGTF